MGAPQVPDQRDAVVDAAGLANYPWFLFFASLQDALGLGKNSIVLWANGTLGIESDAAPAVWLGAAITPVRAVVRVKTAGDASIVGKIYAGTVVWATFTIAAGATSSGDLVIGGGIKTDTRLRLAVTSVAVYPDFPGADLSASLYY